MAGQAEAAAEKLRAYLRELNPGARALLIAEFERGLLRGDEPGRGRTGSCPSCGSLREGSPSRAASAIRHGCSSSRSSRSWSTMAPTTSTAGGSRAPRSSRLWLWIGNTLMPEDAKAYSEQSSRRSQPATPTRPNTRPGFSRTARCPASPRCWKAPTTRSAAAGRSTRHRARLGRRAGPPRHTQCARQPCDAGHAIARPHQFTGRPRARKREGAGRLAACGEVRRFSSIRSCW